MIKSFRDRETERVFSRGFSRRIPPDLHRVAWWKLIILDASERLNDLRFPPGITSKSCPEIVKENIVSVSMTGDGSVFGGIKVMPPMLKSLTTIRRKG